MDFDIRPHTMETERYQQEPVGDVTSASPPLSAYPVIMRVPNTGFGVSLGLAGNSILWKHMAATHFTRDAGTAANWIYWISGVIALALMCTVYLVKLVCYRELVLLEWYHPMRCYFFVAIVVALLMCILGIPSSISDTESERGLYQSSPDEPKWQAGRIVT